jgi:hypothetical protein
VTWSQDLSDALGRAQLQLSRLAKELDAGAQDESGALAGPRLMRAEAGGGTLGDIGAENSWPYLAI